MEASRDNEFDDLLCEVPLHLRLAVKDFLEEQDLNTLDDMASLHQDDLTEVFKAVPAEFTLGHRAVVRRLCASAKRHVMTITQLPSNPGSRVGHQQQASPRALIETRPTSPVSAQRYQHREDERQGSPSVRENAMPSSPISRQFSQRSELEQQGSPVAWGKPRARDEQQESPIACERNASSSPSSRQRFQRLERKKVSANRDASPVMHCSSHSRLPAASGEVAKSSSQHKSVFSRAGARANPCGRETTWSQLAGKMAHGPGFHIVNTTTLSVQPSSPKASIGKTRRPDVFSAC